MVRRFRASLCWVRLCLLFKCDWNLLFEKFSLPYFVWSWLISALKSSSSGRGQREYHRLKVLNSKPTLLINWSCIPRDKDSTHKTYHCILHPATLVDSLELLFRRLSKREPVQDLLRLQILVEAKRNKFHLWCHTPANWVLWFIPSYCSYKSYSVPKLISNSGYFRCCPEEFGTKTLKFESLRRCALFRGCKLFWANSA